MRRSIITAGIALLLATPALAIGPECGPQQGDVQVMLGATGANDDEFNSRTTGGGGTASAGYFVTDDLSVDVRQSFIASAARKSESTAKLGSTRLGVDFHFPVGCWFPFFGANMGAVYGEVASRFAGGPEVGVKYFMRPQTFLYTMAEYQFFSKNHASEVGSAYDDGLFLWSIGLGVNF